MAGAGGGGDDAGGFVRLISADDHVFVLERKYAEVSGTIKSMLAGQFEESKGEIRFPEIRTAVLERVVQYFHFKIKYTNSKVPIPEFHIPPELALDTMMTANFLDC